MKICMIMSTPFPPQEGIGYYVYNLAKKLIEKGYEVTVVTRGKYKKEEKEINGIRLIKAPFIPLYPFHVHIHGIFVNKLLQSMGEMDIIHLHSPLSPIPKISTPIISTIHTSVVGDAQYIEIIDPRSIAIKLSTKLISYPLILKTIKISRMVTTVSKSIARELKEYYGLEEAIAIGNAVDEKIFTPLPKKNCSDYILYVGRLSYRKGLMDLLMVAKQICRLYDDIKFFIVGKGELEEKLKEKIQKEKLQDRVVLLGHVKREELLKLYQNALIFLLPSHYEGLPTVLLEAMACGLPVVATKVSGCIDVINHGHNGFLAPIKSPEQLSKFLSILIEDKNLRIRMGENARKTIEKNYTWDKVTDRIEKCYELVTQ